MSDPTVYLLDTNVFLHAEMNDPLSGECQHFLAALTSGAVRARLEPVVLHELTYVFPRLIKQFTKKDVATYCRTILNWPGIDADKPLLHDTLRRSSATPGLGLVDAYLSALASQLGGGVYSKNLQEFDGQGVVIPSVLPS